MMAAKPKIKPEEQSVIHDMLQGRSIDEVLGNLPNRSKKKGSVSITEYSQVAVPERTTLSASEKAVRAQSRRMLVDYSPNSISALIDLANNADSEMVRLNALKFLVEQGIGRASTTSDDTNNNAQPHRRIDIHFGDAGDVVEGTYIENGDEEDE